MPGFLNNEQRLFGSKPWEDQGINPGGALPRDMRWRGPNPWGDGNFPGMNQPVQPTIDPDLSELFPGGTPNLPNPGGFIDPRFGSGLGDMLSRIGIGPNPADPRPPTAGAGTRVPDTSGINTGQQSIFDMSGPLSLDRMSPEQIRFMQAVEEATIGGNQDRLLELFGRQGTPEHGVFQDLSDPFVGNLALQAFPHAFSDRFQGDITGAHRIQRIQKLLAGLGPGDQGAGFGDTQFTGAGGGTGIPTGAGGSGAGAVGQSLGAGGQVGGFNNQSSTNARFPGQANSVMDQLAGVLNQIFQAPRGLTDDSLQRQSNLINTGAAQREQQGLGNLQAIFNTAGQRGGGQFGQRASEFSQDINQQTSDQFTQLAMANEQLGQQQLQSAISGALGIGGLSNELSLGRGQLGLGGRELDLRRELGLADIGLRGQLGQGDIDLRRMLGMGQLGLGQGQLNLQNEQWMADLALTEWLKDSGIFGLGG